MTRRTDWHTRLNDLIRTQRDVPFVWGRQDCLIWSQACLATVREDGQPTGAELLGRYSSAAGALRHLRRKGFACTDELVTSVLGEPVGIQFARPGDIVGTYLKSIGMDDEVDRLGRSFGVCNGRTSFFVGTEGLVSVPTSKLEKAYRG